MSLMEVVKMDSDLDDLVAQKATLNQLKALARSKNILNLGDEGVRQILLGNTSLQEISRVVDLTDRLT
jgi:general secretion pathway protein E/type IV pilus assembly protein PilB